MSRRHKLVSASLLLVLWAGSVPRLAAEEEMGLGIEETLSAVRQEMEKVRRVVKAPGKPPYFRLKEASLRIQFVMVREDGPDGKTRLKIVPVEVGHDYPASAVHTLTLQMERTRVLPTRSRRRETGPRRREPSSRPQQEPPQAPQQQPQEEPPQEPGPVQEDGGR